MSVSGEIIYTLEIIIEICDQSLLEDSLGVLYNSMISFIITSYLITKLLSS